MRSSTRLLTLLFDTFILLCSMGRAIAQVSDSAMDVESGGELPLWIWISGAVILIVIVGLIILYRAGGGIKADAQLRLEGLNPVEYVIVGRTTRIGAADDNDLVVNVDRVSRHHCVVLYRKNEFALKDLNSLEGTLINDQPLQGEQAISDGDRIGLGKRAVVVFHRRSA